MYRKDHPDYPDRLSLSQASQHQTQPGVRGKDRNDGSWFNLSQFETQKNFIGKGPKGYRRQDASIHEDVCEALQDDPYVDASDIEVEADRGVVTLRGFVHSREMKRLAQECIEDLYGVEDVYNLLKVA